MLKIAGEGCSLEESELHQKGRSRALWVEGAVRFSKIHTSLSVWIWFLQREWIPHAQLSMLSRFFPSPGVICGTSWWDINSFWRGKKIGTFKGPLFVILFSPQTNLLQWRWLAFRHPAQGYAVYFSWSWVALGWVNTEEFEDSQLDKNSWSTLNYVLLNFSFSDELPLLSFHDNVHNCSTQYFFQLPFTYAQVHPTKCCMPPWTNC